jgi:predicted permease
VIALAFHHAAGVPIDARPSIPVFAFSLSIALCTGFLFGTVPAWLSSRADPIESLRGSSRSTHKGSALPQKLLVVLQSALSVLLIAVAGMLTHSIVNLEHQDLGFVTANRLVLEMEPPLADLTLDQLTLRYRDLVDRLSHLPGVHSASLSLTGPVGGGWSETIVKPGEGMPHLDGSQNAKWNRVTPGYFETIGQPILQGRGIAESDRAETRGVVVVNQAFVRRFFKDQSIQSVLGKHFGIGLPAYSHALEIVGVVRDAKSGDLREPPQPMAFGALTQHIDFKEETLQASDKWDHFINGAQLYYSGDAGSLEPRIREAFRMVDPDFAIIAIQPMQQLVDVQLDQQSAVAQLSGIFSALALVLAAVGLYGVTAHTVARRTREIGLRMAIGADRLSIARLVFGGALAQVAVGVALGLPASILLGKLLSARLYHVAVLDLASLVTAIATLCVVACIASLVPAVRAATIDPIRALRAE